MNQEKIGLFIQKLRKEKNMTQQELGDLLGINGKSVSKWERGVNCPDISILSEIVKVFNISIDELLNGEKKTTHQENNQYFKKLLFLTISIILTLFIIIIYHNYTQYDIYHIESESDILKVDGYFIFNHDNEIILFNDLNFQDNTLIKTKEVTLTLKNNNQDIFHYQSKKYQDDVDIKDIFKDIRINLKKASNHEPINDLQLVITYNNQELKVFLYISEKLSNSIFK